MFFVIGVFSDLLPVTGCAKSHYPLGCVNIARYLVRETGGSILLMSNDRWSGRNHARYLPRVNCSSQYRRQGPIVSRISRQKQPFSSKPTLLISLILSHALGNPSLQHLGKF